MTRLEIRTAEHARALFPALHRSPVLDTLVWDGPDDEATFVAAFAAHGERTRRGEAHEFTIVADDGTPVGCCSVRPEAHEPRRGDLGLLVTLPHQRQGHGTRAIGLALAYAFGRLSWEKCEAGVFVGNDASRAAFVRNGFVLEGTRRKAVLKRGVLRDEWLLGLTREEWQARRGT
jgi:RimJ/RimL family protein N-acetyltransferase